MPPNPPFDITTTRSPGCRSRATVSTMSSIDAASRAVLPRSFKIPDEPRNRQAFSVGERRSEHRGEDDLVRGGEGVREVVLEDTPARRGRSRLEDRPDASLGLSGAKPAQRFRYRGRMMGEVVVHRDAAGAADDLETALDARERAQAFANPLCADAHLERDDDRRQCVADVVRSEKRHVERAERRALPAHVESGRRTLGLEVMRLPVGLRGCSKGHHSRPRGPFQRQRNRGCRRPARGALSRAPG